MLSRCCAALLRRLVDFRLQPARGGEPLPIDPDDERPSARKRIGEGKGGKATAPSPDMQWFFDTNVAVFQTHVAVAVQGYCFILTCCRAGDGHRLESLHLSWHFAAFVGAMTKLAIDTLTPREEAALSSPNDSVLVRT